MDGNNLVLMDQCVVENNTISFKTLINTGASGIAFIKEDFTRRCKIKIFTIKTL